VQFSLDTPLPFDLIEKIVLFRIEENTERHIHKKRNK
jgi:uncharacterized protein YdhG (YjbR/CyaY superfamily)